MSAILDSSTPTFLDTGLPLFSGYPYKVAELSEPVVTFGRKELDLSLIHI